MDNERNRLHLFKRDLKELLIKHGASFSLMVGEGSDTHGIYDEGIGVQFKLANPDPTKWSTYTDDFRLVSGWDLGPEDLE